MIDKHTVKNCGDGWYEYRGYTIKRRDHIPHGYYGRWYVWPKYGDFGSRQEAIDLVNKLIQKKEQQNGSVSVTSPRQ
jgi:hypothetical protein